MRILAYLHCHVRLHADEAAEVYPCRLYGVDGKRTNVYLGQGLCVVVELRSVGDVRDLGWFEKLSSD